jgi:tetratricopeptide (TPR) repeat protein
MSKDVGRRIRSFAVVGVVIAAIAFAAPAGAQIPDKFTNLEILPKDIAKPKLVETMRGFSTALGVRCWHCHVGEEGKPFDQWDFPSDAKPAKNTARVMMQMTAELNSMWMPQVKTDAAHRLQVSCAMCHHGKAEPYSIQGVLRETIGQRGVAAATAQYRELRERFYGRDAYDFGEQALNALAQSLADEKKTADALALLELNAEFNPKSPTVHGLLAAAHEQAGHKDQAIAAYKKVLELAPNDERAKRKLAELQGR